MSRKPRHENDPEIEEDDDQLQQDPNFRAADGEEGCHSCKNYSQDHALMGWCNVLGTRVHSEDICDYYDMAVADAD